MNKMDPEFKFVLDRMADRYIDTDRVLKMFIRDKKFVYDEFEKFAAPLLLTLAVNQAALMLYILKKEGHQGFPAEVTITKPENTEEGGDE